MRRSISGDVPFNSFEYLENCLITANGYREYDVRWRIGQEINPNGFVVLGLAYGTMLKEVLGEEKVVIGHDFRSYSQPLMHSLALGLMASGAHVIDVGLALSPMVYFAQHLFNVRAAMVVTASHNENGWTGIKIADGLSSTLGPEGITTFREYVNRGHYASGGGRYEIYDNLFEDYAQDMLKGCHLTRPRKVVIATGNGTAGHFLPRLLRRIPSQCIEVIELDCHADWTFPVHNPNPEDVAFLEDISKKVLSEQADLGIGIDGDGDRIGVVDNNGHEIFSDKLGLLLTRWMVERNSVPGQKVVIDVKSTGLFRDDPVLAAHGAEVVFCKTGHSYMKAKVREVQALAGIEKSGHWFFNPPYGRGYDDAVLSSLLTLQMLEEKGLSVSALQGQLAKTWQSPSLGVYCADNEKYQVVDDMIRLYIQDRDQGATIAGQAIEEVIDVNGIRFGFGDGSWGLIRASSNKPSLVLVTESRASERHAFAIMQNIRDRLAATGKVGKADQEWVLKDS